MSEIAAVTWFAAITSVMWAPYILQAMLERGIMPVLDNPRADAPPLAPWAERARRAHANAVENLVVFAALALAVVLVGGSTAATQAAAAVFLAARAVHYLVYVAGIPVVRTLAFLVGFGCQIVMAGELLL